VSSGELTIKRTLSNEDLLRLDNIVEEVYLERHRQMRKWGEQNHDPVTWMPILMEEVGEAAQEALRTHFGAKPYDDYRKEVIQVAAVALAMLEALDRNTNNANRSQP